MFRGEGLGKQWQGGQLGAKARRQKMVGFGGKSKGGGCRICARLSEDARLSCGLIVIWRLNLVVAN
jgi:hypothetical protein